MTVAATQPHVSGARPRLGVKLRAQLPSLLALALMAALLPFRQALVVEVLACLLALALPGLLLLRAIGLPSATLRAFPLYLPPASLLVVMLSTLIWDLCGPLVGVGAPLRGDGPAGAVLVGCGVLWLVSFRTPDAACLPWRSLLEAPMRLCAALLPLLAAAGAMSLNSGGGGVLAIVAACLTILTLLGVLWQAERMSWAGLATLLFACALAAAWSYSLRGQEIVGFDITSELAKAQSTLTAGVWHLRHRGDAYGAMLSLTLLPSAIASLTGIAPLFCFKAVYPAFTALLPAAVALVAGRFLPRRFAAAAAALLIINNYFFEQLPQVARQEVALVFFAALVAALLNCRGWTCARRALICAMSVGLVISHYSSAYLAIAMLLCAALITSAIPRLRRQGAGELWLAFVVLAAGSAVWYGVLTQSTSELSQFVSALRHQGLALLPNGSSNPIQAYLSGNVVKPVSGRTFQATASAAYGAKSWIHPLSAASSPRYALRSAQVPASPLALPILSRALSDLSTLIGELMLVAAVLGVLALTLRGRPALARRLGVLGLGALVFLVVIRFSGTVAAYYNQTRALLQCLLVLTPAAAFFAQRLARRSPRPLSRVTAAAVPLALAAAFAWQLGALQVALGGGGSLNLANAGEDFERFYIRPAELAGARWASAESYRQLLYADRYGQLRLYATTGRQALDVVAPSVIDRHAWVYGDATNIQLGRARGELGSAQAIYSWPREFLNTYFDRVFNDGSSAVYHR